MRTQHSLVLEENTIDHAHSIIYWLILIRTEIFELFLYFLKCPNLMLQ